MHLAANSNWFLAKGDFMRKILLIAFLFVATSLSASGCGGGSSGAGSNENEGATLPAAESFDDGTMILKFNMAMDQSSVTEPGNINLACGELSPTIAVALAPNDSATDPEGDEYKITISDSYKYQLLTCTLAATTNVASADGTHPAEEKTYSFTPPCELSDDFNSDTRSCWSVYDVNQDISAVTGWASWEALLDEILAFDTSNSALDYNAVGLSSISGAAIYKDVTVNPSGFEIVLHIKSSSGIDDGVNVSDIVVAQLSEVPTVGSNTGKVIYVGLGSLNGTTICVAIYSSTGQASEAASLAPCNSGGEYYIRLAVEGSVISTQYSTDGVNYTDMTIYDQIGAFPSDEDFSDTHKLSLILLDVAATGDNAATIDSIVTSGITLSQ